nr:ribonuclease H-like domain-containing protein [Tanacetum cinerariifolium]
MVIATARTRLVVDGVVQPIAPTTAEQILAKKNELKARETLLTALPDKHQLMFNIHKDAKSWMEAIEKRFGGNKETKKVQKTLLKQQYENFTGLISAVTSISATSTKVPVSALPNVDNLSDAVIYSFFASQSNSPQLDNDDLKQINADDLEEMDLKWKMAMLTIRARRSPKDTRNKDTQRRNVPVETSTSNALVSQCDGVGSYDWSFQADEEPINYVLMVFTSSSSSNFDNEVAPCSKACLESVEARLVVYQQNENVFEEDIKLLKLDVMLRDNTLTSSKNLSKLLASQVTDKTGLGYDNQVFNSTVFNCDKSISSESDVSMPTSPVHDRYKLGEGYHAVPPPYTGTFMPLTPDLVFHDAPTASETVPTVLPVEPSITKINKDLSQSTRPSAPIIKS